MFPRIYPVPQPRYGQDGLPMLAVQGNESLRMAAYRTLVEGGDMLVVHDERILLRAAVFSIYACRKYVVVVVSTPLTKRKEIVLLRVLKLTLVGKAGIGLILAI